MEFQNLCNHIMNYVQYIHDFMNDTKFLLPLDEIMINNN